MARVYRFDNLGKLQTDWLDSRHHFSFGEYRDPARMGFGNFRVINDDTIKAGTGFDFHPHRDMEIITYVRTGTIIHHDSLGNEGRTPAGDVQVMSAGTGIVHAEYADPDEETTIFQIWILPDKKGVGPRWEQAAFPVEPVEGALRLLVSGRDEDQGKGALYIHQNAAIYGGRLMSGTELQHPVQDKAYVVVSDGEAALDGENLKSGDCAEISGQDVLSLKALSDAEVLVIEI